MSFFKRKINNFLVIAIFLLAVFLFISKVNAQVSETDFEEAFSKPYNGTLQHDEWNKLLGTTTDQMFDSGGNPYGFFLSTLYPSITKGQLGINITPGIGAGGTTLKVRSHGGNILGLHNNTGSEILTVLNNGNMGLGITNPSQKIDVNGIVKATAVVSTGVTSHPTGIGPYVETYVYGGDTGRLFAFDGSSYYDLAIGDWNSGNPNIMLKTGGNVGINRGNPSYKLDVAGTLRTDNGANLATVSGNIGIGTTAPATKLHVVGGGSAIVRNDTMSFDNDYDLINKGYLESVIPDIIASSTSSTTDLFWQGSLTGNISNANSGNVGIGTTNPVKPLTIESSTAAIRLQATANPTGYYTDIINNYSSINPFSISVNNYGTVMAVGRPGGYTGTSIPYINGYYGSAILGNDTLGIFVQGSGGTNGNVGIGTTNPSEKLHVSAGNIIFDNGYNLRSKTSGGVVSNVFGSTAANQLLFGSGNWDSIRFDVGGVAGRMYINSSGNVGISTTAPATKLHVVGGGSAIVRNDTMSFDNDYDLINKGYLDSAIPNIIADATSSLDYFWGGSTSGDVYNLNSGNVGIGKTNPDQKLDVDGNIQASGYVRGVTIKGTVNTAAATVAKEVTISNYTPTAGDLLALTFSLGNTISNPTLNINGTGAANIRIGTYNVNTTSMYLGAGATVLLYYDGSYYQLVGSQRYTDATTDGNMYFSVYKTAGDTIYRYKLVYEGDDGRYYPLTLEDGVGTTKTVQTRPIKIGGNIFYHSSTGTVNENATFTSSYSEINLSTLNYTFNQSGGYTNYQPIYLVGTIDSNGYFVLDDSSSTSFYTQTLPNSEDGKVYMYLGQIYSTNSMRLTLNHPIYEYKNGRVQQYIPDKYWTGSSTGDVYNLNTGNIGIGTDTPQTKLNVIGGNSAIVRNDTMSFDNDYDLINLGYLNSVVGPLSDAYIQGGNSFTAKAILGTNDSFDLGFETAGSEKMTILANGNVGIGTTNPIVKLQTSQDGGVNQFVGESYHSAPRVVFNTRIARGTESSPQNVVNGDKMGEFVFGGYYDGWRYAANIGAVVDGEPSVSGFPTRIEFYTTPSNSFARTERMRIKSSGNVGIGTTAPATKLHVVGGGSAIVRNDTMSFDNDYDLINLGYLNSALNDVMIPVTPILDNAFIQNGNSFNAKAILGTNDSFDLGFKTAGSEKMTILANGNVGIGTTNPNTILDIRHINDVDYSNLIATSPVGFYKLDSGTGARSYSLLTLRNGDGGDVVIGNRGDGTTNRASFVVLTDNDGSFSERFRVNYDGNVGIGTTAPATKLHVVGGGSAIVRNDTMSFDNDYDLINKGYLESVIPDIIASSTSSIDSFWDGDLSGNIFNLNSGNIGIGTNNPSSLLTIANNNWISAIDGSGASSINMFKVNTSNQIEVGAPLLIGPLEFAPDSGLLSFIDMPVTSASLSGTPHGYSLRLDGNNLLSIYGESNGSGGIVNSAVGVGIATPQYGKLEVRNTLGNINTGITLYAGTGTTARSWLGSGDQWHLTRGTDSSYGITILNSGHTAVKGTNPVAAFEILGGSHARNSTVSYTGNQYELVNVALLNTRIGDSVFWSGSQTGDISNTNTGNVGIGAAANSSFKLNIGGSVAATGASLSGQLVMTGSGVDANISGVNKLTAYTIDPLYNIEGVNYSTYAAAIVGGVKEEYLGKLKIDEKVVIDGEEQYQVEIDFTNVEKGSDAWVWYQVVDFSKDHVDVSYIPYGNFASVYYIMTDDKIIFRSDREAEISFRITGSRYDWKKWPTIAIDQNEKGWEVNRD